MMKLLGKYLPEVESSLRAELEAQLPSSTPLLLNSNQWERMSFPLRRVLSLFQEESMINLDPLDKFLGLLTNSTLMGMKEVMSTI